MEGKKLSEALKIVYDIELNNYLLTNAIIQLDNTIANLGFRRTIREPKRTDVKEKYRAGGSSSATILCLVIGGLIGLISGCSSKSSSSSGDIFDKVGNAFSSFEGALFGAFIGVLIGGAVGFVISLIISKAESTDYSNRVDSAYNSLYNKYVQEVKADDLRVEKELKQRDILWEQRIVLYDKLQKSKEVLVSFYNIIGLDSMFRYLIPVGYMNELMRLNDSSTLDGPNGLNYLVRKDLREDQIRCELKIIRAKLDTIISNQSAIYSELQDMNAKCDRLVDISLKIATQNSTNNELMKKAVDNSEAVLYAQQRTNAELSYMNTMNFLSGKYK